MSRAYGRLGPEKGEGEGDAFELQSLGGIATAQAIPVNDLGQRRSRSPPEGARAASAGGARAASATPSGAWSPRLARELPSPAAFFGSLHLTEARLALVVSCLALFLSIIALATGSSPAVPDESAGLAADFETALSEMKARVAELEQVASRVEALEEVAARVEALEEVAARVEELEEVASCFEVETDEDGANAGLIITAPRRVSIRTTEDMLITQQIQGSDKWVWDPIVTNCDVGDTVTWYVYTLLSSARSPDTISRSAYILRSLTRHLRTTSILMQVVEYKREHSRSRQLVR